MTTKLLNNRYQVIQVLGAGGFGETFLAEDIHLPSRRRCVIKQLKPLADDPKTYQKIQHKFEREAATLEFLGEGSEQIPNLFAYFSEDGLFYLVQEWIQGQTLTDIVENQGCLNEEAVKEILLSLLPVLEYVHSKGIIHRDIKPDNIILRNSNRKPVLIDFGAVKETVRTAINSSGNTTKSMVIGTPGYMPIEQAVGRAVFATDIYSLGLTAIYLFTGKHPQELEINPQTGELIWESDAPGITESLKQVLNQAINPNIGTRFSTASKMLYALESNSGINTASPVSNNQNTNNQQTQKTVAVSPVAGVPQNNISSNSNSNSNSNSQTSTSRLKPGLIFAGFLGAGLIGGMAIANFNNQQPEEDVVISQTSPPDIDNNDSDDNLNVNPSPEPSSNQNQIQSAPIPEAEISPQSQTPQVRSQQEIEIIEPTPEATPELKQEIQQPQIASTPPTQPQIILTPQPTPTPTSTPETEQLPQNSNNSSAINFPVFPTGTSESNVKSNLGQPTKVSRGLWNTRAYLYKLQPNKVDLGLLFDRQSGKLRQTEASLAQSVGVNTMQNTLQGMLKGNINGDIQQGLQRVYQRQSNQHSFQTGNLKGIIQRNKQGRIYIAVWDADLH